MITYMHVLDAEQQGADWRDVSRIVLRIDLDTEADRARIAFESHLSHARRTFGLGTIDLSIARRWCSLPLSPCGRGWINRAKHD
jgi:hypothetical protein